MRPRWTYRRPFRPSSRSGGSSSPTTAVRRAATRNPRPATMTVPSSKAPSRPASWTLQFWLALSSVPPRPPTPPSVLRTSTASTSVATQSPTVVWMRLPVSIPFTMILAAVVLCPFPAAPASMTTVPSRASGRSRLAAARLYPSSAPPMVPPSTLVKTPPVPSSSKTSLRKDRLWAALPQPSVLAAVMILTAFSVQASVMRSGDRPLLPPTGISCCLSIALPVLPLPAQLPALRHKSLPLKPSPMPVPVVRRQVLLRPPSHSRRSLPAERDMSRTRTV
mmetsp:Transcript_33979/g.100142  ORF Transcript_33979/g.100142 Transcript_33979/m.100142 type:complete len:278 (-) Transcript_33979:37-870(-)